MRVKAPVASATLAITVTVLSAVSACGSNTPGSAARPACGGSSGPNRVEIVVQHGAGRVVERCVGFKAASIPALTAMRESGVRYSSETTSFGVGLCAIDGEPAQYATCFPAGAPYWAMFVSRKGGAWTAPSVGIQGVKLGPGDALGWRYDPQAQNPAAPPPAPPRKFA